MQQIFYQSLHDLPFFTLGLFFFPEYFSSVSFLTYLDILNEKCFRVNLVKHLALKSKGPRCPKSNFLHC